MKYLLSVAFMALLVLDNVGFAQSSQMRGESDDQITALDLNETSRNIQCALLVEEIEEAGYAIDIEEGFDEEWEEDIWIATDEEEIEALTLDVEEAEDISEGDWEAVVWDEEESFVELVEDNLDELEEEILALEETAFEVEDEEFEEFAMDELFDEIEEAFLNWDEELEEWELEEFELEEDIDLMEAIYNAG